MSTYAISTHYWTVRDEPDQHLLFHLQTGDYLPTLTTIIGILASSLQEVVTRKETPLQMHVDILENVHKELKYVTKNYELEQKRQFTPLN